MGAAKDFCPNFPKLARKVFCATFAYKFSPTKIMKTFFRCDLRKLSSYVFLQRLGGSFLKSNKVGRHFYPDGPKFSGIGPRISGILPIFSRILPGFSTNHIFFRVRLHPRLLQHWAKVYRFSSKFQSVYQYEKGGQPLA